MSLIALVLVPLCLTAETRSKPVVRDELTSVVAYSEFQAQAPDEVWRIIDGLEFWAVPTAPPRDFYDQIDTSSSNALRNTLHSKVKNHRVFRYSHESKPGQGDFTPDTWDIVALADGHPEQPDMVLDIYMNATFPRQLVGPRGGFKYDREHSWPKSLGFPTDSTANPPYSDCHHLFAAYSSYNGSRSNKPYGEDELTAETRKPTVENLLRGGSHESDEDSSNYSFGDTWRTWLGRRGDVARAMFYMDVRYEGNEGASTSEPNLHLTDDIAKITTLDVAGSGGDAYMGLLSVLLKWHEQDPVDDLERRRNTVVYLFQGNRNPFIDHPEWVNVVYGGASISPSLTASSSTSAPWINEIHYDNAGADVGEFVEVAGPAGLDLSGWTLLGYNGSGGKVYKTITLSGIIPDLQSGFGVIAFDFPGMQNDTDGLALVDSGGRAVELLSFEGKFTATDGPATEMISSQIAVQERGDTPSGHSLQRKGTGNEGTDFTWIGPLPATKGLPNFVD